MAAIRKVRGEGKLIVCECVLAEICPVLSNREEVLEFLIGAHAATHADRLVARDRGYLRDYFKDLVVVDPSL